jgi:predicted DNA-binding ribbon-helix-helix protein
MQSAVIKRSIIVSGHKTSVSLEDEFWLGLKEIGKGYNMKLSELVAAIDARRPHGNLSSAIRLFVLDHFRAQVPSTFTDRGVAGLDLSQVIKEGRKRLPSTFIG